MSKLNEEMIDVLQFYTEATPHQDPHCLAYPCSICDQDEREAAKYKKAMRVLAYCLALRNVEDFYKEED